MTTGFDGGPRWDVDPARLERNWRAIAFELDAPRPGRLERGLRRLGLPAHLTRLVVATPALRRAWFVAIALVMALTFGSVDPGQPRESLFGILLLAPLVPVLGVSFAYGIEADPAHEISVATPMRGLRLLLTRSVVVVTISTVLLGVTSLSSRGVTPLAFGWLLPSLALTSLTVALMTRLPPRRAAAATTIGWMVVVLTAAAIATDRLAVFGPVGQGAMIVATGIGLTISWFRRERFDRLAVQL